MKHHCKCCKKKAEQVTWLEDKCGFNDKDGFGLSAEGKVMRSLIREAFAGVAEEKK